MLVRSREEGHRSPGRWRVSLVAALAALLVLVAGASPTFAHHPITTSELASGAVTTAKILDGTIRTADLKNGAVTSAKILDGTIRAADLKNGAVTSAKILDGTIVAADLAANSVGGSTIIDGTISSADIADGAVTTAKVLNGTILAADFAAGAVDTAAILDGTVTSTDIANATIVGADLAANISISTGTGTLTVGAAGTAVANVAIFSLVLTPVATDAAIGTNSQTFTVTGLAVADKVIVNGPAPTSLCPMVSYGVSALNTLELDFSTLTAAACTPADGTYTVVAIR